MISVNGKVVPLGTFPNGEINLPKLSKLEWGQNLVVCKYESDADLFRLMLVRNALTAVSNLHIPYFPYSRMDRANEDYEFTLQSVANYINWLEWDSVTLYEPHSDVTPALLDNCVIETPMLRLLSALEKKYDLKDYQLFYPDAGAQKRYQGIWETNALVGFKHRDFRTGRITELQVVGTVRSDTIVIVDDLCSKGGTFVLAAEELRKVGVQKIYLIVAHCERTIFEGKVFSSGLIDGVLTTDSILDDNNGEVNLEVVPMIV